MTLYPTPVPVIVIAAIILVALVAFVVGCALTLSGQISREEEADAARRAQRASNGRDGEPVS